MYNTEIKTDCPSPTCPNPRNHFYINRDTGQAFCHRCNIAYKDWTHLEKVVSREELRVKQQCLSQKEDSILVRDGLSYRAKKYLKSRGILERVAGEYNIREGENDKWVNHLIFTCPNTGYQFGRSFLFKTYRFPTGGAKAKSFWSHGSMWEDKNKDIPARRVCVVVEGVFDAIAIDQAMNNYIGVALMGSYMTKEQEIALRNFAKILVWLDPDARDKQGYIRQRLQKWGQRVEEIYAEEEPADNSPSDIRRILTCE